MLCRKWHKPRDYNLLRKLRLTEIKEHLHRVQFIRKKLSDRNEEYFHMPCFQVSLQLEGKH